MENLNPIKQLTTSLKQKGGRNAQGRITVYHRGGGHKKRYRLIDFKRSLYNVIGKVLRVEYDPNRSANIALICYSNGILSYIIAPEGLKAGEKVVSGNLVPLSPGNSMPLNNIPLGTFVHNVELKPKQGAKIIRSAGTFGQLIKKTEDGYILVRLASGEERLILGECLATIGIVSNPKHKLKKLYKAGQNRWLGKRPTTRGVAMNPVDHPHGGRTNGGRPSVSPWGKLTKGVKTRSKSKSNKFIIRKRIKK